MKKNWKTSLMGLTSIAAYIIGMMFPDWKPVADSVVAVVVGGGLLAAKDSNVTGTGNEVKK